MKLPAIRSRMGIWMYYVTSLSFEEVNKYVKPIDNELHNSELLSEMIQRSITDNYKSIANYLETQEERFFNALILAVYDGQPMWNEIQLDDYIEENSYNLGILTLNGEEKIFPVDGQHRVAGIKKALENNPLLANERVPVIFIGHSKDALGMQRTRRMFSTLNRYAKPVSLRDIIALDEDDIVAIASRALIDETDLFSKDRILDSKNKSIPDSNNTALTTIITYYECNKELLWLHIKDIEVRGLDDKVITGRTRKINEFIRHRPSDEMIKAFTTECRLFWEAIMDSCDEINTYPDNSIGRFRNKDGGHIFFRPVALIPFTKAIIRIKENNQKSYKSIFAEFNHNLFWIQNKLWRKIIWDNIRGKMVMGNGKLIEYIFLYMYDKSLLTKKELETMEKDLSSIWDVDDDVFERLNGKINEEVYI